MELVKKSLLVVSIFVVIIAIVMAALFINFRNSYKYTMYQNRIAAKYKNSDGCNNFDFEKILENNVNRRIRQSINLDETLGRQHDYSNDTVELQLFENMKNTLVKQEKIRCETQLLNGNENLSNISDFQLFWYVYRNINPNPDVVQTVEKINKNKYEIEYYDKKNDDYQYTTFEKINKKWVITDHY